MKRSKWDVAFSNNIRERDGWTCQRCLKKYDKNNSYSRMGLHCSHYVGRGRYSTRFEPLNAVALCYGCHRFFTSHPIDHTEFFKDRLGAKWENLMELKKTIIKKRDVLTAEKYKELK